MIQYKSKHPYSSKYDRWYPMLMSYKITYDRLNFEDYSYIFGDKVFREDSAEAKDSFEKVILWMALK